MKMNSFNTNAHDFRSSKRKCFSLTCCLIFVFLMSQASCRPSETETDSDNGSNDALTYKDKDYVDPDDINWKNFGAVETTSKVHPIIYYKEDMVSEDYDPSKETKKTTKDHDVKETKPNHSTRKYKEIFRHQRHRNQTENYRYIKPEKVYFDINPIEHHGTKEASSNENDNKFNEDNIHIEVISLFDEDNTNTSSDEEEFDASKNLLSKKPKKYNNRYRRDVHEGEEATTSVRLRHKRNPFIHRYSPVVNQLPSYGGAYYNPNQVIYSAKYPVQSPLYHNAESPRNFVIVNRNGFEDEQVWGVSDKKQATTVAPSFTRATRPPSIAPVLPPRRPSPNILQSGDEDYRPPNNRLDNQDVFNRNTAPVLPPRRPSPNILQSGDEDYRPPNNRLDNQDVFNRNTGNWGTRRPNIQSAAEASVTSSPIRTSTRRISRPQTETATSAPESYSLSACIFAISSCCTANGDIRYACFERLKCNGAFWDINPCSDEVFRSAVDAVDAYFE